MPTTHTQPASATKAHGGEHAHVAGGHYMRLLVMTALSFAAMYALMYAMVDRFENVYNNINQVYMAGLMAASMVVIFSKASPEPVLVNSTFSLSFLALKASTTSHVPSLELLSTTTMSTMTDVRA